MVIISDMDTQYRPNIWYLPSESNHVNKWKVTHLLIMMLMTVPLAPTAGVRFTPNTILINIISLFKTVSLIILDKTKNHKEDLCLDSHLL